MEMVSELLAICEGNLAVDSPTKADDLKLMGFFVRLDKLLNKQLRCC